MSKQAVFLDRDGVLNRAVIREGKPYPPAGVEEMEILPGVPEALSALKAVGFLLVVVTNQPDVARGKTPRVLVASMNARLKSELPLDEVLCCFHDDVDQCDCRKPKPGLLLAAAQVLGIDLKTSFMVGDRWRDIEAGTLAGCKTMFIDYGYVEKQPVSFDFRVGSLLEAAQIILKKEIYNDID
jgi:D-glycero-D-manno-heptose 1,7-bisphosphate phosphatase